MRESITKEEKDLNERTALCRQLLELGFDRDKLERNQYDEGQLHELLEGLSMKLDVTEYDDPSYVWYQMREIRLGIQYGYDADVFVSEEELGRVACSERV